MRFCIEVPSNHYITFSTLDAFIETVEEALKLNKRLIRGEVAALNAIFTYSHCYRSLLFLRIPFLQSTMHENANSGLHWAIHKSACGSVLSFSLLTTRMSALHLAAMWANRSWAAREPFRFTWMNLWTSFLLSGTFLGNYAPSAHRTTRPVPLTFNPAASHMAHLYFLALRTLMPLPVCLHLLQYLLWSGC